MRHITHLEDPALAALVGMDFVRNSAVFEVGENVRIVLIAIVHPLAPGNRSP